MLLNRQNVLPAVVVGILAGIMAAELVLSVREKSQTWDEAYHLLAGYRYWQAGDFGINSEHPPLVKLLTGVTLLWEHPKLPQIPQGTSKVEGFVAARKFLYSNDADALLLRARLAASFFSILLALLIFAVTRRMFGLGAAVLAMTLGVFEPNLLAHGALVTTDAALSCLLLAAVYAFHRYLERPTAWRLAATGMTAGLALAAKFSGVLVVPTLTALALVEFLFAKRRRATASAATQEATATHLRSWSRLVGGLAAIFLIALLTLWSVYAFRFRARPGNLAMTPPLAEYVRPGVDTGLPNTTQIRILLALERWKVLPEAYLYGFADVLMVGSDPWPSFLFGKLYAEGHWFYFPATLLIKFTLGFLGLIALALGALAARRVEVRRELLFVTLPAAIFFAVGLKWGLNVGVRHILPVIPFLIILASAVTWRLAKARPRWAYLVAGLAVLHVASSLRAFPDYLAYSNEAFGGPSRTYRVLSDTNTDWGQGLIQAKQYLDRHRINNCWLAYFGSADPGYYRIPCKHLPDVYDGWWGRKVDLIPPTVEGTVLVSATQMAGVYTGPGELNPYRQFLQIPPDDSIGGSILVYRGRFDLTEASRLSRVNRVWELIATRQFDPAMQEARALTEEAPRLVGAHYALGFLLARAGRKDEARQEYQTALNLARTVFPEFQLFWVRFLEVQLSQL
ncbi:MAG: glycosyltransferase family 39 protein [Terriglobia bacterium]